MSRERCRVTCLVLLIVVMGLSYVPIITGTAGMNDLQMSSRLSDGADILSSEGETSSQKPWVTRFMNISWEKVGLDGKAQPRENITGKILTHTPSQLVEEERPYPTENLNYTVADGSYFVVDELCSEDATIRSDPGGYDAEATPLTPAKEGHWFPQMSYSRLYFDFMPEGWYASYKIHLEIEQDQDSFSRYLRVKVDGTTIYTIVIGWQGFHGDIVTPAIYGYWHHSIDLEIHYGGYREKGWKLEYFWVYNLDGAPMDVTGEFTHKASYCNLYYQVEMGANTILHLKTVTAWDPYLRSCYVYVDGVLKLQGYAPGEYEVDLGDYQHASIHEVRIKIWWSHLVQWGKKITIMQVHHDGGWGEVDYFQGHAPLESDLAYLESYYILHGYKHVDFFLSSVISGSDYNNYKNLDMTYGSSSAGWVYLRNKYFSHSASYPKYVWILFAHYIHIDGQLWEGVVGVHYGGSGILIHDQLMNDYSLPPNAPTIAAWRRTVTMHEFGHHINIIDYKLGGGEEYCSNPYCCMHEAFNVQGYNVNEAPWYCAHHWGQNYWPGW